MNNIVQIGRQKKHVVRRRAPNIFFGPITAGRVSFAMRSSAKTSTCFFTTFFGGNESLQKFALRFLILHDYFQIYKNI